MNCWEFKKCGRHEGGDKCLELGVCPATQIEGAGEACWLIAGTFCEGEIQGTYAHKQESCYACDFYQQYDFAHKFRMLNKFEDSI